MSPQSPQPRKRAGKQEMLEREQEVMTMITHGFSKAQILQTLMGQGFHEKKASRAYKGAMDTIAGLSNQGSDLQRGKVLSRLDSLYKNTTVGSEKNYKLAVQIVALQAGLLAKVTGEKRDAPSTNPSASSFPQGDVLTARLAAYFEKHGCERIIERSTD